ncbi:hypothetical protein LTR62_007261 [Meristemomyces frigidus]|uniref:Uncharacterized protein n=1 Tax=Meristemomyces frigidus TaxID=1508187 RepID=A0AAN7TMG0_9PEZI|nr:hypothetical protein LTR62_007261 [Meristemomyces frigidus]
MEANDWVKRNCKYTPARSKMTLNAPQAPLPSVEDEDLQHALRASVADDTKQRPV